MSEKVYGLHAVRALLTRHAERVTAVTIAEQRSDPRMAEIQKLATAAGKSVKRAAPAVFKQLFGEAVHQGVFVEVVPLAVWHEEELIAGILRRLETPGAQPPFVLVLDGVQDPHNLGAILRSADGAGVHAVIAPKDRAVGITEVVRRISVGAADHVPFVRVTNLARTMDRLKETGVWLVGTSDRATQSLYECDLTGPLGIVMGAEGAGLRRLTEEKCDFLVKIPMRGRVECLNVSVATGVCLFEALRQRETTTTSP
jgi:23S rRNA (guanosine2251-2'-O)-methyltransferase